MSDARRMGRAWWAVTLAGVIFGLLVLMGLNGTLQFVWIPEPSEANPP